jgi:pimeloyl-ACP methyl ester carboxylesterase
MPSAACNGVDLFYEALGQPSNPAVVLLAGSGAQLTMWPDTLCRDLVAGGYRVVRFDNRDVGYSTRFEGAPDLDAVRKAWDGKRPIPAIYSIGDMADDTFGLMDRLGIAAAHLVGMSMGGVIAQRMAIARPERVLSLTSISSTTGDRHLRNAEGALPLAPPASEPPPRDVLIDRGAAFLSSLAGSAYRRSIEDYRRESAAALDRSYRPGAIVRQFVAVLADAPRGEALKALSVPALVVHGTEDRLCPPEHGAHTAACLRNSEHLAIDGMGHNVEPGLSAILAPRLLALFARADASAA